MNAGQIYQAGIRSAGKGDGRPDAELEWRKNMATLYMGDQKSVV